MIKKIEHFGIAVSSLNAQEIFKKILNTNPYKVEKVESEKVNVVFFNVGESKLELLEPTDESSVIAKYISKKGEGMHHLALKVDDIYTEIARLKNEGFEFINEEPKHGADNQMIVFLHPKCTNGVLIELCEEIKL